MQAQNDAKAVLHGELYSIQCPKAVDIIVNSQKVATLNVHWEGFAPFGPIRFGLRKGENVIEVISHNPPITTPTDNRPLAVAVRHVLIEIT